MVDGATDGPQPRQARIVLKHNQGGDIVALLGWSHNSLNCVTPEYPGPGWAFAFQGIPDMDYHNWVGYAALTLLFANISTGGGAHVSGDVRADRDVTLRDRISIYADTDVWRSGVARDLAELREENERLKTNFMIALILVAVLFLFGFVATSFAIYRFDRQQDQIDILKRGMERYFYTRPPLSSP